MQGEPGSQRDDQPPQVSSAFGAFDSSGFDKASAYWFRSWWRDVEDAYNAGDESAFDRPALRSSVTTVFLLDVDFHAAKPTPIYVYSSAFSVELYWNGQPLASAPSARVPRLGYVSWMYDFSKILYGDDGNDRGNLTAIGRDSRGSIVGTHSRMVASEPAAIVLSVDVPSPSTVSYAWSMWHG